MAKAKKVGKVRAAKVSAPTKTLPTTGVVIRQGHICPVLIGAYKPDLQAYACFIFLPENVRVTDARIVKGGGLTSGGTVLQARVEFEDVTLWADNRNVRSVAETEEEVTALLALVQKAADDARLPDVEVGDGGEGGGGNQ